VVADPDHVVHLGDPVGIRERAERDAAERSARLRIHDQEVGQLVAGHVGFRGRDECDVRRVRSGARRELTEGREPLRRVDHLDVVLTEAVDDVEKPVVPAGARVGVDALNVLSHGVGVERDAAQASGRIVGAEHEGGGLRRHDRAREHDQRQGDGEGERRTMHEGPPEERAHPPACQSTEKKMLRPGSG
jgi:hypothetical protein